MTTVLGMGLAPHAAHSQAVSTLNGSLGGAGGEFADRGAALAIGRLDIPVGSMFGLQLDPFGGAAGGNGFWGVGGDFFTRDPSIGALGAIVSVERFRGADVQHYGAGGEYYAGPLDLALQGGYQGGNNVAHGGFIEARAGWYLTDNLEIGTASRILPGARAQSFDAEYLPGWTPLPNMSLFADGQVGARNETMALFGVRFYFGPEKSLKDRHHTDDPWASTGAPFKVATKPAVTTTVLSQPPLSPSSPPPSPPSSSPPSSSPPSSPPPSPPTLPPLPPPSPPP